MVLKCSLCKKQSNRSCCAPLKSEPTKLLFQFTPFYPCSPSCCRYLQSFTSHSELYCSAYIHWEREIKHNSRTVALILASERNICPSQTSIEKLVKNGLQRVLRFQVNMLNMESLDYISQPSHAWLMNSPPLLTCLLWKPGPQWNAM